MYPRPLTNRERKGKKSKVQMMYLAQMEVQEGLDLLNHVLNHGRGVEKLRIMEQIVKRDFDRFAVLTSVQLKCFRCGVEATHFQVEKHRNDRVMPFQLNLYANNRMLTWDHILPKSYDGSNNPINGRCACSKCNEKRGNDMTMAEMVWVATQNPIQIYKELPKGKANLREIVGMVRKEYRDLGVSLQ
jgi:hypothetical protein